MNYRSVFFFAVVGLLLVSSLDAAKPAKGKGKKASGEVKAEKTKVDKNAEPVMGDAVVLEESMVLGEAPTPKIYRPRKFKVLTAYDQCKMDCQKIRDNQDLHSYAAQLRDELAAAEAALGDAAHQDEAEAPAA